jgi:hypothetical protein
MNDTIFIIVIIITLLAFLYAAILSIQMNFLLGEVRQILRKNKIEPSFVAILLLAEFKEFADNASHTDGLNQRYNQLYNKIKRIRKITRGLAIVLLSIWVFLIMLIIIAPN